MLKSLTGAIVAVAAFGGLAVQTTGASAMPMIDTSPAITTSSAGAGAIENVRWVCGPFRCFWRPNYYRPYPVYGYRRPYYGWHRPFYGYHRGWHHPHYGFHRGWHRW